MTTQAPGPATPQLHRGLDRLFGIPHLTAAAAGLFRIAIGLAVMWLIWTKTSLADPSADVASLAPGTGYGAGTWGVAHWIRTHPDDHLMLWRAALIASGSLALGLFSRVSAALLCGCVFLLVAATLTTSSNPAWAIPMMALPGLVLAPLGDAWSLDALRRRHRIGRTADRSPAYGFAIWWIGLVLGVTCLASAASKLRASGLDWALGGALRYHFVEDAGNAPAAWGLWIANQPRLAVALSCAGLMVEALLILVIFRRRERDRLLCGMAFALIQLQLFLFQGLTPWPVWALMLAFLPWQSLAELLRRVPVIDARVPIAWESLAEHLERRSAIDVDVLRYIGRTWRSLAARVERRWTVRAGRTALAPRRLGLAHAVILVMLVSQQAYASTARVEYEPLLAYFTTNAETFASWDEFFRARQWHKYQRYRFHVRDATGARVDLTDAPALMSPLDADRVVDTLRALYRGLELPDRSVPTLTALHERLRAAYGAGADRIDVAIDTQRVNFEQMRIEAAVTNLHAFTLRLSPPALEFVAPELAALGVR